MSPLLGEGIRLPFMDKRASEFFSAQRLRPTIASSGRSHFAPLMLLLGAFHGPY
jgi:hypothetical protein